MIPVEEALERILSRITVLGDERVGLGEALGRVLAEPVVATRDIPPWPNSSMDGYALRAADTGSATAERPARLRVAGEVPAGRLADRPAVPGEAWRIFTGAPLPEGTDAIVPQEDVVADAGVVAVSRPVPVGDYVRPRGEDMRVGDRVLEPGRVIGPADVGAIATVGLHQVRAVRRPVVGILSTGDEIVDLGGALGPGQIPNSNTYSLVAQVLDAGGRPVNLGVARDRLEDVRSRLAWGLGCDLLISSAGVSVGDHDHVKAALAALGAEQHLWLVDMRPGKPVTFASIPTAGAAPGGGAGAAGAKRTVPVFGLPGNPVSAMVTFELFVRPALRRMAGQRDLHRPTIVAEARAPIPNPGSRRGYLRVRLDRNGGGWGARLTGEQGSGILRSMVEADGLAIVPGDTTIAPGQPVTVMLLRPGVTPS